MNFTKSDTFGRVSLRYIEEQTKNRSIFDRTIRDSDREEPSN